MFYVQQIASMPHMHLKYFNELTSYSLVLDLFTNKKLKSDFVHRAVSQLFEELSTSVQTTL